MYNCPPLTDILAPLITTLDAKYPLLHVIELDPNEYVFAVLGNKFDVILEYSALKTGTPLL